MNPFKLLLDYAWLIYLLSAVLSLVFGLVIFTLRRNARMILQEKRWATPFGRTFFVLASLYSLRFLDWLITPQHQYGTIWNSHGNPILIAVSLLSGVTNYLFLLSAYRLSGPDAFKNILRYPDKVMGRSNLRILSFLVLCGAALVQLLGRLAQAPDAVLSALALFLMGFVLYRNIQYRRDRLMARVALVSAIAYAVLYLSHHLGLVPFLLARLGAPAGDIQQISGLLASLISLLLKFGLFFPGYSLMLLISGPVEGIEGLLRNITRGQEEYLENNGIIRSIREELGIHRVGLYIKLPSANEHHIALYEYPASGNGNRRQPPEFDYETGTNYDRVMQTGEPHSEYRKSRLFGLIPGTSSVSVPVYFHNAVIACLNAVAGEGRFTEADRSNFERVAVMISPAVQAYREIAALNKISADMARLQMGIVSYEPDRDVERITEIIHNVVSALATGVSIEIGFSDCRGIYAPGEMFGDLTKARLTAELAGEDVEEITENHRWLKKALVIPMVDANGRKTGEQILGKFVFATDKEGRGKEYPTIGTNPTCRRAIADLLTDTLVDFVRGYLNQLTDRLGVRLSSPKRTRKEWLDDVARTAKEAGLLWAVARYADRDDLDGESGVIEIVKELDCRDQIVKWESMCGGLWLTTRQPSAEGACHIIKKVLKNTGVTVWLGVARPGFGLELSYESPWKYYLDHFFEVADSAFDRVLIGEQRQIELAEAQSIAMATMTTFYATHELANLARSITSASGALEKAINAGRLSGTERHKRIVSSFQSTSDRIETLLRRFASVFERDERRPCSLNEAVEHAIMLVTEPLDKLGIRVARCVPPRALIDVPFHAAADTLAIVIDNAKDAIRYRAGYKKRLIEISVEQVAHGFTCEIRDWGQGVPTEVAKTLFKCVSKSEKPHSHGVGLYFSAGLLRTYGGDITLKSPGPDPTIVTIHFPKALNTS